VKMPRISPFQALRYDSKKVSLKRVVCPPYDVINKQQRKGYIRNSAYNAVNLVLPERKNGHRDYEKAKRQLYSWVDKGMLKKDDKPTVYIYAQEYKIGNKKFKRTGFLALLKLKGKKNREALPHEKVFQGPLQDRVRLMKRLKAHLSPIFIIFRDKGKATTNLLAEIIRDRKPDENVYFEGIRHKVWKATDEGHLKRLTKQLDSSKIFIADGHHRFEASMVVNQYFSSLGRSKTNESGHRHTMVYFVSSKDTGLIILPTYRAVEILPECFNTEYLTTRLSRHFKITQISVREVDRRLRRAASKRKAAFVIYYEKRYLYAELKDVAVLKKIGPKENSLAWKRLDVSILHNLIFEELLGIKEETHSHRNIFYYKDAKEMIKAIDSGGHRLGVFLNPTRLEEVERIAEAGERMPHKSTYFYPKALTGLAIHKF